MLRSQIIERALAGEQKLKKRTYDAIGMLCSSPSWIMPNERRISAMNSYQLLIHSSMACSRIPKIGTFICRPCKIYWCPLWTICGSSCEWRLFQSQEKKIRRVSRNWSSGKIVSAWGLEYQLQIYCRPVLLNPSAQEADPGDRKSQKSRDTREEPFDGGCWIWGKLSRHS